MIHPHPPSVVLKVSNNWYQRGALNSSVIAEEQIWKEGCRILVFSFQDDNWRCVCEGCGENSMPASVMQNDAQARGIICENLHIADIDKITDLKSAKETWDRLHMLYGANSSNSH